MNETAEARQILEGEETKLALKEGEDLRSQNIKPVPCLAELAERITPR